MKRYSLLIIAWLTIQLSKGLLFTSNKLADLASWIRSKA